MAMKASMLGLRKALKVQTAEGDFTVNPADDPMGYSNLLVRSHDRRVADARQEEDALPLEPGVNPAQDAYFKTFNRGQQDAATGPAGFNRQWTGFLEAPNVLQENNPDMKYRYDYSTIGNPVDALVGMSGKRKLPARSYDDFVASVPGLKKRLGEL